MKLAPRAIAFAVLLALTGPLPTRASDPEPAGETSAAAPESIGRVPVELYSPQQLVEAIQAGEKIIFLDVREPEEFAVNHLPGAINIPEGLLRERKAEIPREGVLIPYCNMDFRGFVAVDTLRSLGFKDVALMQERGLLGWKSQGLPVVEPGRGLTDAAALEKLSTVAPKDLLGERHVTQVPATGVSHSVQMKVTEWHFSPNDLVVDAGDRIEIEVRAERGSHYFILPDYELQTHVPQGETRKIAFVADKPGEFKFGSCEWDGSALQIMKGRLQVREPVGGKP